MLFHSPEMDIQFVQVLQQGAEGCTFGHLGEGIDILGEALAAIAELAVGAGDVGVRVVDVAGEEDAGMDLAPIGTHLLAIFAAGVEVGHLVGAEHVVHVLGQFGLQRGHHGELLAHEDPGEQFLCAGEHHRLLAEVLEEGTLGEEFGHIAHLVAGLTGEHLAGAGQDGRAHEHGDIGQVGDEFLHQREVLRAVVFGGDVDLEKRNVDIAQVIIVALRRVADEQFALRVVMFQPVFQCSAHEAASDNTNVDHCVICLFYCFETAMAPSETYYKDTIKFRL